MKNTTCTKLYVRDNTKDIYNGNELTISKALVKGIIRVQLHLQFGIFNLSNLLTFQNEL